MITLYNKNGETITQAHKIDADDCVRSGEYFYEDPTIVKKVNKPEKIEVVETTPAPVQALETPEPVEGELRSSKFTTKRK